MQVIRRAKEDASTHPAGQLAGYNDNGMEFSDQPSLRTNYDNEALLIRDMRSS